MWFSVGNVPMYLPFVFEALISLDIVNIVSHSHCLILEKGDADFWSTKGLPIFRVFSRVLLVSHMAVPSYLACSISILMVIPRMELSIT